MATDDPMAGYIPLEHFQLTDDDASTVRIRDMPYGKRREQLTIYPTALVFPQLSVNSISPGYPIMLTNTGYDVLVISDLKVVGDFAIVKPSIWVGASITLVAGQHVSLTVTYNPKREGTVTGGIYFNTGSAAGEEFVHLTGSGTPGSGTIVWMSGTGSPEGKIAAKVGSVFCRTDGGVKTTMYVKEAGAAGMTGWVAK
jgi:hypothetical protein